MLLKIHANDFGDARFLHGHAIKALGRLHGVFVMRDDDELSLWAQLGQQPGEAADIGIVERCVDLVQDAHGTGTVTEDRDQQRQGGQRLLAS